MRLLLLLLLLLCWWWPQNTIELKTRCSFFLLQIKHVVYRYFLTVVVVDTFKCLANRILRWRWRHMLSECGIFSIDGMYLEHSCCVLIRYWCFEAHIQNFFTSTKTFTSKMQWLHIFKQFYVLYVGPWSICNQKIGARKRITDA